MYTVISLQKEKGSRAPAVTRRWHEGIYKKYNLSNVHLILGKTESGKTNVLQMIEMPEWERTYNHEEGEKSK